MLLGSRPNSLPQRLRVPFEHVMKAGLTAPVLPVPPPECAAARTIPPSAIIVSPRVVAVFLFIHDYEVIWRGVVCLVRSNDC